MKKTTYIFITFIGISLSLNLYSAVIDEENENGSSINKILRTSQYWGKNFIEYFLSSATQNDIKNIKLSGDKELIKYIDDFFEDYKKSYGKKRPVPIILAWKWFGIRQPIELKDHTEEITSVAISHHNKFIVTGSSDKTAKIWNSKTGKLFKTLEGHTDEIISITIGPDDSFIITGSDDKTVKICKIWTNAGKLIKTLLKDHLITLVATSRECNFILGLSGNITPRWNNTLKLINRFRWDNYIIFSVAISHDEKFIVTGSDDNKIKIWDWNTGDLINTLEGHTNCIRSVAISYDDKFIVTGSDDNTVKIWDIETGKLIKTLKGHSKGVNALAISYDNSFIVTVSADNTAKIWDRVTGEFIKTLKGHSDSVSSVAISHDYRFIVTSSSDKTAKIWFLDIP